MGVDHSVLSDEGSKFQFCSLVSFESGSGSNENKFNSKVLIVAQIDLIFWFQLIINT